MDDEPPEWITSLWNKFHHWAQFVEFSPENTGFLNDIWIIYKHYDTFKQKMNELTGQKKIDYIRKYQDRMDTIYEKWVSGDDAYQINLPSRSKKPLIRLKQFNWMENNKLLNPIYIWQPAEKDILCLIESDSWVRFQKTEQYQEWTKGEHGEQYRLWRKTLNDYNNADLGYKKITLQNEEKKQEEKKEEKKQKDTSDMDNVGYLAHDDILNKYDNNQQNAFIYGMKTP